MSGRRRQRDSISPSLFPFLAVLLCTMGSLVLILMLVVSSAQASAKQVEEESRQQTEVIEATLNMAKRAYLRRLEDGRIDLEKKRLALQHFEEHIRELLQELSDLEETARLMQDKSSTSDEELQKLEATISDLEKQLAEASEKLEQVVDKPDGDKPIFAIIPYEGAHGTHRRPIYLECVEQGLIVQPEGVLIRTADLQPPHGPGNPLDAALRTIRAEFAPANGAVTRTAYPLLVVRPSGIRNYSLARGAMSGWDDQFGYELIEEDLDLTFPSSKPGLEAKIVQSIELARQRQEALVMAMPRKYRAFSDDFRDSTHGESDSFFGGAAGAGNSYGNADSGTGSSQGDSAAGRATGRSQLARGNGRAGFGNRHTGDSSWETAMAEPANASFLENLPIDGEQAAYSGPANNGSTRNTGQGFDGSASQSTESIGGSLQNPHLANNGSADSRYAAGNAGQPGAGGQPTTGDREGLTFFGDPASGGSADSSDPSALGASGRGDARSGNRYSGASSNNSAGAERDYSQGGGPQESSPAASGGSPSNSNGSASSMSAGAAGAPGSSMAAPSFNGPSGAAPQAFMPQVNLEEAFRSESAAPVAQSRGRNWAWSRGPTTQTSVVRPVHLHCFADRWVLLPDNGDPEQAVTISFDMPLQTRAERLADSIQHRVESWGIALAGGYWKPIVIVDVAPDAAWRFDQLVQLLDGSGLEVQLRERKSTAPNRGK